MFIVAVMTGAIGGITGTALIAVVSRGVTDHSHALLLATVFFGLCLITMLCKSCSEIVLLRLTQRAICRMRVDLSSRLLATPLPKLQELGKHGLLTILTKDIDTFIQATHHLPGLLGNGIVIATCLAYLAFLSWQLFTLLFLCMALGMGAYLIVEHKPMRQLVQVRRELESLYQHFRSLIEGSKELQLNIRRAEFFLEHIIGGSARKFEKNFVQAVSAYIWVANLGTSLLYLILGVMLFLVPRFLPEQAASLTTVTLIILYLIRPIAEIVGAVPPLRQANIALTNIARLDAGLSGASPRLLAVDPFASSGPLTLALEGVCHRSPGATGDSRFTLGPLNLQILQGEILFIVGGNGSGKTTFALLLLGLYQPEAGTIRLNGVQSDVSIESYRQYFSAVFADFHLFEHLLITQDDSRYSRAMQYIGMLEMSHKVRVVDGKFSTTDLSTGQRKRLALVVSYLEDRPIYLFDEWAADQDPVFKRVFYTELLPELKSRGKTVIVISHDDTYFSCADRIVKLNDGQLQVFSDAPVLADQEC